jgi:hypothetical protein
MTWLDRWSRRGLGPEGAERVSAGCYGSIVAASTLAGSAAVPPGELALLVVATNLVYFSTHVFAYSIGDPNVEGKHLPQVAAHHARVAAPMVSAAFLPLVVVLVLEILGADHQRATSVGVITAAGLLVVVGLPGAYLHWGTWLGTGIAHRCDPGDDYGACPREALAHALTRRALAIRELARTLSACRESHRHRLGVRDHGRS